MGQEHSHQCRLCCVRMIRLKKPHKICVCVCVCVCLCVYIYSCMSCDAYCSPSKLVRYIWHCLEQLLSLFPVSKYMYIKMSKWSTRTSTLLTIPEVMSCCWVTMHWNMLPHIFNHTPLISLGVPSKRAKCTVGGDWNNDIILEETAGASSIHSMHTMKQYHKLNVLHISSTYLLLESQSALNHSQLCCHFLSCQWVFLFFDVTSLPVIHYGQSEP